MSDSLILGLECGACGRFRGPLPFPTEHCPICSSTLSRPRYQCRRCFRLWEKPVCAACLEAYLDAEEDFTENEDLHEEDGEDEDEEAGDEEEENFEVDHLQEEEKEVDDLDEDEEEEDFEADHLSEEEEDWE